MTTPAYGAQPESLRIGDAQVEVPDWFRTYLRAALQDVLFNIPDQTVTWLTDQVALRGLAVPIGQVIGFAQFTAQASTVITAEATTSTTYTDLATVGPSVTGLSDGGYLILYGARLVGTADVPYASIEVNGDAVTDDDGVFGVGGGGAFYGSKGLLKTLAGGGNNTVTMKFKSVGGGSVSFRDRWLITLKYANK